MKLLLDTSICIYIIKRKPVTVLERFQAYQVGDIGISSITLSELRFGIAKSEHQAKNANALEGFITPLEIVPFGEEAALAYGKIRATLEKTGTIIGPMDMLIAAHAVVLSIPLVTNNKREFERVSDLDVLDWTV